MLDIDWIEADDCGEESNIGFCDRRAVVVRTFGFREMFLDAVEGAEKLGYGFCVGLFCGCEARAVDAVINVRVDPFV